MSHYKTYKAYKDSVVPGIERVPAHWEMKKIAWDMKMSIGWTPPTGQQRFYGGSYNWVTIADLSAGRVTETKTKITQAAIDEKGACPAPAGSLLFSYKLSVGEVALLELPAFTNEAIAAFHPVQGIDMKWWFYAAPIILPRVGRENIYGALLLNQELMNDCRFMAPDVNEQAMIADALVRETAHIDALIDKKQRFLALLNEKQRSFIAQMIAKGTNPDAPMKYSEIEWLGEVPAHWTIQSVKRCAPKLEQGWSPQCESEPAQANKWGVLKVGCVNGGRFERSENKALPPDIEPIHELTLKSGDLLISRANTRELVGSAAVVLQDEPRLMLCDKLYRAKLVPNKIDPEYLAFYLSTPGVRNLIELDATGTSASMVNISQSTILDLKIALPGLLEQMEIVRRIRAAISRITNLSQQVRRSVELLKERRMVLIAAAVTGQIDLREAA